MYSRTVNRGEIDSRGEIDRMSIFRENQYYKFSMQSNTSNQTVLDRGVFKVPRDVVLEKN